MIFLRQFTSSGLPHPHVVPVPVRHAVPPVPAVLTCYCSAFSENVQNIIQESAELFPTKYGTLCEKVRNFIQQSAVLYSTKYGTFFRHLRNYSG